MLETINSFVSLPLRPILFSGRTHFETEISGTKIWQLQINWPNLTDRHFTILNLQQANQLQLQLLNLQPSQLSGIRSF